MLIEFGRKGTKKMSNNSALGHIFTKKSNNIAVASKLILYANLSFSGKPSIKLLNDVKNI